MSSTALLLLAAFGVFAHLATFTHGCQLPSEWRPLSEGCRAELAEIIVYARVLAVHREPPQGGGPSGPYNSLPVGYGYEGAEEGLLYSAEVEMLCDQAWGSMLEVPTGSRLNLTGLGYLSCQSHTVMENYSYFFFLRMDDNYNFLPHGVNFQDAIFADTSDNRRTFSSLFQFSNCTHGSQPFHTFSPEWDTQEDSRLLCSSVQAALFEEEDRGRRMQERLAAAERRNRQLKERVRKLKRSLGRARGAERGGRRAGHHLNAVTQEEEPPSPPGRYANTTIRKRMQL